MHHTNIYVCRPPPIESRRAGLRGGKPEEQTHSSPDENRPSNDQAGSLEAGPDELGSGSHADSRQQAAAEPVSGDISFGGGRPEVSEHYNEVQDADDDDHQEYMQNRHHAVWSSSAAAPPLFQRSFGIEPVYAAPGMKDGDTHHSFFT